MTVDSTIDDICAAMNRSGMVSCTYSRSGNGRAKNRNAIANQLPAAAVMNRSGRYVTPDVTSVSAAAATTTLAPGSDLRVSITDPAGSDAYPIASFTWLLVRRRSGDPARAAAMKGFLEWMTTPEAQAMGVELGYAPLPAQVAGIVRDEVAGLR